MFQLLANLLAQQLIRYGMIESQEEEIYRYGFEILIYFIVNVLVAFGLGAIFGEWIGTGLFLGCYCTLRQFTGGYHAKNYLLCTLTFATIYTVTLILIHYLSFLEIRWLIVVGLGLSFYTIYRLAPLEHPNKPLQREEKVYYRKISLMMVFFVMGILICLLPFRKFFSLLLYPVFAVFWIAILLILGKKFNKK